MTKERRKELILSIILKSFIVAGGIVGLVSTFFMTKLPIAKNELLYYTVQSNIWIWAVMVAFLVLEIVALASGKENIIPSWLRTVKYVFTVAITLTCFVYNFVLFPASLATPEPSNPLLLSSFFTHIFVPVLAIADFIRFDYKLQIKKWTLWLGITTPLYYFVFAIVGSFLGASFKNGSKFPYFFLDYEKLSWFGFKGMPGVFYWIIIVLGIVLAISWILLIVCKKRKNSEKIKEFKRFRANYAFEYQELNQKEDGIYLGNTCLEDAGGNKVFEGDDFINTSYGSKNSISKVLSNLYPHCFVFRGKKVASIEGVLQGIKYKDKKLQNKVLSLSGLDAYHSRACNRNEFWGNDGVLYWQGKELLRNSQQYQDFLDELYFCAAQNPIYRKAILSTGDKKLIHHIGNVDEKQTVLTRKEYEWRMMALREFLKLDKE